MQQPGWGGGQHKYDNYLFGFSKYSTVTYLGRMVLKIIVDPGGLPGWFNLIVGGWLDANFFVVGKMNNYFFIYSEF